MQTHNTALHKGLELVNRRAETMFKTFESGSIGLNLMSLGLGGIGMAAVGLGVAFNSTQQQAALAFGVLLKGPGEAAAAMAGLNDLVGKIPFTLTPIMQAGQRLVAAGWKDVPGLITTIADAISATGDISNDKLQSVVGSFVQLKSSGVFSMGVISDLTAAGIPIIGALAKQMGMTEYATTKMLEGMSGKVPSDFVVPKIVDALRGLTGGLAAREMNTLSGSIVALQDNFGKFMASLTGGVTDAAQGAVSGLAEMFDGLRNSMAGWDPTIKKTLGFALLLGSAVAGVGGLGGSVPGLGALGSLFGGGGGMAGPILAVVITLIGLIALLTPWQDILDGIRKGVGDTADAVKTMLLPGRGDGGGPPSAGAVPPLSAFLTLIPVVNAIPALSAVLDLQPAVPPLPALSAVLNFLPGPIPIPVLSAALSLVPVVGAIPALRASLALVPVVGAIPALAASLALVPVVGAIPALSAALTLIPAATVLQGLLWTWTLGATLALTPSAAQVQALVDAWPLVAHGLSLVPQLAWVQAIVDAWADVPSHGVNLVPQLGWVQAILDAWTEVPVHGLALVPQLAWVQAILDGWAAVPFHGINLVPEMAWVQAILDAWTDVPSHGLNLVPQFAWPQAIVNAWEAFTHPLNLIPHIDLSAVWETIKAAMPGPEVMAGLMAGLIAAAIGVAIVGSGGTAAAAAAAAALIAAAIAGAAHPGVVNAAPAPGSGLSDIPGRPGERAGGGHGVAYYPDYPGGPSIAHSYANGGMVPGLVGSPQLAVVHGGEEVLPVGGRGGGGLTVNITVNGPMLGTDLEDIIVNAVDNARRRARV